MTTADVTPAVVSYADNLPLAWQPLPPQLEAHWLDRISEENVNTLGAVTALEERRELPNDANPLEAEINRLNQKMDWLLGLVGSLVHAHLQIPQAVALHLSSQDISWRCVGDRPEAGAQVLLEIYLHRGIVTPLRLPAEIVESSVTEVKARFLPTGEACLLALEKHVFLHHRRAVFEARHATQT
jgi:hypothetical protein